MEQTIDALTGLAAIVTPIVMIIAIVWLGIRQSSAQRRMRVELQKEILSKFSSGQELSEFLGTEAGKQLMQGPASRWGSRGRVITLAVSGMVLVGAGAGFYVAGQDREAVALFTGVGLALLASSVVSYWLAKKFGLSDTPGESKSR